MQRVASLQAGHLRSPVDSLAVSCVLSQVQACCLATCALT